MHDGKGDVVLGGAALLSATVAAFDPDAELQISTRRQRFAHARLPGPHLTHHVRLFLNAHHDGLQPTQLEVV
jgi:hypothetical protein